MDAEQRKSVGKAHAKGGDGIFRVGNDFATGNTAFAGGGEDFAGGGNGLAKNGGRIAGCGNELAAYGNGVADSGGLSFVALGFAEGDGSVRRSLNYFPMVREVTDQPNDQPFRYGVCRNSLAFLLSNSNLSAFQFSFTPGVR